MAFGDSLTRGANPKSPANTGIKGYAPKLQELLGDRYLVINCGIGGQTTTDGLARIDSLLAGDYSQCSADTVDSASTAAFYDFSAIIGKPPSTVFLWMGTNNLLQAFAPATNEAEIRQLIEKVRAKNMQLIVSNVPPMTPFDITKITDFNTQLSTLILDYPGTQLIDVFTELNLNWAAYTWDGIHMSATAYESIVVPKWMNAFRNLSF